MRKFYKENREYLISAVGVLGLNAFIYFIIKLFIPEYHLIYSPIDDKIPLVSEFIIIYMLWYPYLFYSYYLVYKKDKQRYRELINKTALAVIIANVCFVAYPTMVDRPTIDNSNIFNIILNLVYISDFPVNCLPSMHCLLSFLIMFEVILNNNMDKWIKVFIVITSLLIVLSTLLVKQHVIYDVLLALIISVILSINRKKEIKCLNYLKI